MKSFRIVVFRFLPCTLAMTLILSLPVNLFAGSAHSTAALSSAAEVSAPSADHRKLRPTATPVFSLASGNYATPQNGVTLSDATRDSSMRWCYSIHGGIDCDPAAGPSSAPYTSPIYVGDSEYLCAQATADGHAPSAVSCKWFAIANKPTPVKFSSPAGNYSRLQSVKVSVDSTLAHSTAANPTVSQEIHCTTDGTTPDYTSPLINSPIPVTDGMTIQCVAGVIGAQVLNDQTLEPSRSEKFYAEAPSAYPGWKSACSSGPFCYPGGNTLPSNRSSRETETRVSGASCYSGGDCLQFSESTGPSVGNGVNSLWSMVSGSGANDAGGFKSCDRCGYQVSKYMVYLNPDGANAAQLEYDSFNFRPSLSNGTTATGLNTMWGRQCNRATGHWQTLPRSGSWADQPKASCTNALVTGVWHTYVTLDHIVIGDTSCTVNAAEGGTFHTPVQYYDKLIEDGASLPWGVTNCTYPLRAGYSSDIGHQYQINMSVPNRSASEIIDHSSVIAYYAPSQVSSATYTIGK